MARKLKGGGWSFKQERRVLELAAQSKSPEEIANLTKAIHKVAIRLGISLSKNKRRPAERTANGSAWRLCRLAVTAEGEGEETGT